jgi:hypothetical protein
MMTVETIVIDGKEFIHTFSDLYMIKQLQTGLLYIDALDPIPSIYTYEETKEVLPFEEMGLPNPFDNEEPQEAVEQ